MYKEIKETRRTQPSGSLQQSTLDPLVSNPKKYNMKDHHQVAITEALVTFIAGDLLPLSIVESPRFHDVMDVANVRYQVPSRKHLSTKLLSQRTTEIREKVMKSLQKAEVICVTVDLWSSRQMRSYFGMTARYVADWCLPSVMLACSRFHGSHIGDAISEEFEKTIASFQISRKVSFTITDSASNMLKAFSLPGFEEENDDSEDENDDSEGEEVENIGFKQEKLESFNTHHLTPYDRKILEELVQILTPFETATHCIQEDKVVTSSMVVPCVRVLKSTIDNLNRKYTSRFVANLKASVYKRLLKYEEIDAFLLASALDPRFKLKWCTPSEYNELKASLISKLDQHSSTSDSTNSINTTVNEHNSEQTKEECEPQPKMRTFFSGLIDNPTNTMTASNDIDTLVEEYLLSPSLPEEADPLAFWKNNQKNLPH